MALLVLNAGSSSIKFSIFAERSDDRPLLRGGIDGLQGRPRFVARRGEAIVAEHDWPPGTQLTHGLALSFLFEWGRSGALNTDRVEAVGHRVVHGGTRFTTACLIDAEIVRQLEALTPLAPLHQPHNVAAIKAVLQMAPGLPQVACFDTAFHRTQPAVARAFALPRRFADEGVQRYGFHGLSYEYIASALPSRDRRAAYGRTIVAHLGNGASLCALRDSRSVATTMGFTALDGLVMGTRCGAIDPGALLYLMAQHNMSPGDLETLLYEQSGLLGVSGVSSDMRTLLGSADPHAQDAIELFIYRVQREIGALAAVLGGVDAIVFTGGIGEHAPAIRARICRRAGWLGLELDDALNAEGAECISRSGSHVTAWVIPANEELMIARHTRRVLARAETPSVRDHADGSS